MLSIKGGLTLPTHGAHAK